MMNNLHRSLAPISTAAWAQIDDAARDAFSVRSVGRRVVDVPEPAGPALASIDRGHLGERLNVAGAEVRLRQTQQLVHVRVPFTVSRSDVDDVERGARDLGWDTVSAAAATLIDIEDRAILHGWECGSIVGLEQASTHDPVVIPADLVQIDDAVAGACNVLRLSDVEGPYDLVLPQELYRRVSETTDHGRPITKNLEALLAGGSVLWAPAAETPLIISKRGGDATLYLGIDASIGYASHDADTVDLYLEETFTVLVHEPDAAVALKI